MISEKPIKQCPYCYKETRNLASHIINNHPTVAEKIEEIHDPDQAPAVAADTPPRNTPIRQPQPGEINLMIRDKLETMLNIKLIQMLEKGASIEEINRMMTPPAAPQPNSGLDDIKKLVEIQRLIAPQYLPPGQNLPADPQEPGFDIMKMIELAAPILMQLIGSRLNNNKMEEKNGFDTRELETRSPAILKPIQDEVAGDPAKSGSTGEESGAAGQTEQQDHRSPGSVSQRT